MKLMELRGEIWSGEMEDWKWEAKSETRRKETKNEMRDQHGYNCPEEEQQSKHRTAG